MITLPCIPHGNHHGCLCCMHCVQKQINEVDQQIRRLEEKKRYLTGLLSPWPVPLFPLPSVTTTIVSKQITCSDVVDLAKKQG